MSIISDELALELLICIVLSLAIGVIISHYSERWWAAPIAAGVFFSFYYSFDLSLFYSPDYVFYYNPYGLFDSLFIMLLSVGAHFLVNGWLKKKARLIFIVSFALLIPAFIGINLLLSTTYEEAVAEAIEANYLPDFLDDIETVESIHIERDPYRYGDDERGEVTVEDAAIIKELLIDAPAEMNLRMSRLGNHSYWSVPYRISVTFTNGQTTNFYSLFADYYIMGEKDPVIERINQLELDFDEM